MSGFTIIKSYLQARASEKKSREKILQLQEKKFRKMIKFAYKNSSFYQDLYRSKGISEKDLGVIKIDDLPIVDKDVIMDNFDDVVTTQDINKQGILDFLEKSKDPNELYLNKYHVVHTSGSSGKIGVFVYSKKDWDSFFPYITRVFDFKLKKNKSVFFGAAGGHFLGASFSAWLDIGLSRFFVNSRIFDITKPLTLHIKKLNVFQPNILGGYFTGLKILAEEQEKGRLQIRPDVIVNCGEGIITKDKEYIEGVFGVSMTNLYGLAECAVMGVGKNRYDGIYLMDDLALVEIRKDHALLTNLYNKTQPLIRYRINDFFEEKIDTCRQMPFTLVNNIVGRNEYMLWLENYEGKMDFIHPLVIVEFYVKGLEKFQIVVKDKKSFDFLAVITDTDKEQVVNKIREKLDKLLLEKKFTNVRYHVKVVDNLSVDPKTGKFKLIVVKNVRMNGKY
jgi:phenylacetate-CoA ligase